jgi:hypothetical protein
VRRALDGFLAVLSPCPEIRRNHLPSWSWSRCCRRRDAHHLPRLVLPEHIDHWQVSKQNNHRHETSQLFQSTLYVSTKYSQCCSKIVNKFHANDATIVWNVLVPTA